MKHVLLGDICDIQSGGTPSRSCQDYWKDGDIPWVKISDISGKYIKSTEEKISQRGLDNSSAKLFPAGTILYTIFATLGTVGILDVDAATNQAIAGLQLKDKRVVRDFLYYYLESCKSKVNAIGRGVAQNNINMKILRAFEVPLYNVDKQKEIVKKFNVIENLLCQYEHKYNILEQLVKSRFIEMFGDPVANSKEYPVYKFSDITTSRLGKMLDKKRQTGKNNYPYLANYNVQWFRLELDNLNEMDFDEADRQEFELKNGDLLVCEGGEVGRCAIWRGEKENCYFQKALHRVRCDPKYIIPEYLGWTFYWHSQYNGFIDAISGVSTIAHLPGDKLKQLQIIVPPLELQNQFANFVAQADKSKLAVRQSIETLQTLKAKLMQDYFN